MFTVFKCLLSEDYRQVVESLPAWRTGCVRRAGRLCEEADELYQDGRPAVSGGPSGCVRRAGRLCQEGRPAMSGELAGCVRGAGRLYQETWPAVSGRPAGCVRGAGQLCQVGRLAVSGGPAGCGRQCQDGRPARTMWRSLLGGSWLTRVTRSRSIGVREAMAACMICAYLHHTELVK